MPKLPAGITGTARVDGTKAGLSGHTEKGINPASPGSNVSHPGPSNSKGIVKEGKGLTVKNEGGEFS